MADNPYEPPSSLPPPVPNTLDVPYAFRAGLFLSYAVVLLVLLLTGTVARFASHFLQAAPLMILALPIVVWVVIAYYDAKKRKQLEVPPMLWLVPLLVIPFAMLAWGAVFANNRGIGFQRWQLDVLHWTLCVHVLLSIVAVIANHGRRSFVGAVALLMLLFALSCTLTAGSAVTGDWL